MDNNFINNETTFNETMYMFEQQNNNNTQEIEQLYENEKVYEDNPEEAYKIKPNNKYFMISIYALSVIVLGALMVKIIFNFEDVLRIISNLISTFSSFIVAFFIAYFINPVVKWVDRVILEKCFRIRRKKVRTALAILTAYLVVIAVIVLLLIYIIPEIVSTITDLSEKFPYLYEKTYDNINKFFTDLENKHEQINLEFIKAKIQEAIPGLIQASSDIAGLIVGKMFNFSVAIVKTATSVIIAIVVSVYMVSDKHIIARNATRIVHAVLPKKSAVAFCYTVKECNQIFYNFVIGKAIDSLIIGIITFVAMHLCDLNYILIISIIVGITNMIPYFGPFIGAVPGAFILLVTDPIKGIVFIILIFIIQQFDGLYLGPKILGDSVGLSPLWIIFGISLGGAMFGWFGMFVGVPFVAVVAHLINKFVNYRLAQREITDEFVEEVMNLPVEIKGLGSSYANKKSVEMNLNEKRPKRKKRVRMSSRRRGDF